MPVVQPCEIPADALLRRYFDGPGYADCYRVAVPIPISQARYVEAFYTTPLFKVERTLLGMVARRPATDDDARALGQGQAQRFSAWRIEGQTATELLLADITGRTRSWLRAAPDDAGRGTVLYFGSAVVPHPRSLPGQPRMGAGFHALTGFHRLYSRLLLGAAARRLTRSPGG